MKIEKVARFRVMGMEFETLVKAQDAVDGEVHNILKKALLGKSFGLTSFEIMKVAEAVIANKAELAALLSCAMPDAEEWEE